MPKRYSTAGRPTTFEWSRAQLACLSFYIGPKGWAQRLHDWPSNPGSTLLSWEARNPRFAALRGAVLVVTAARAIDGRVPPELEHLDAIVRRALLASDDAERDTALAALGEPAIQNLIRGFVK